AVRRLRRSEEGANRDLAPGRPGRQDGVARSRQVEDDCQGACQGGTGQGVLGQDRLAQPGGAGQAGRQEGARGTRRPTTCTASPRERATPADQRILQPHPDPRRTAAAGCGASDQAWSTLTCTDPSASPPTASP